MNPTTDVLEQRITALEGGAAALAVSSGQTATAYAVQNLARAGDNIVSSTDLYGGTWNLFQNTLRQQGIEVRFVDPSRPENFAEASDERTRAYYAETLPNPKLEVFPIAEVAEIGRERGIPLIVDNTAAPILTRPLDHGAAVVVHSLTKYIGGHGTSIGGVIIDGGNFDWGKDDRFPTIAGPHYAMNEINFHEEFGPAAFTAKFRAEGMYNFGPSLSPTNAFHVLQGIETLPLRMQRHMDNTEKMLTFFVRKRLCGMGAASITQRPSWP